MLPHKNLLGDHHEVTDYKVETNYGREVGDNIIQAASRRHLWQKIIKEACTIMYLVV